MKLTSFSASKYRSIIKAHRLGIRPLTVLIGRNNEGKSNLLAGLAFAMEVVQLLGHVRMVRGRIRNTRMYIKRSKYEWQRDYPIQLQDSQPDGESAFRLCFKLDENERKQFKRKVGNKISDELPIEIKIGHNDPLFRVIKQGPGSASLNKKREKIAKFIGNRIECTYIPAVRTAQAANEVVREMVIRDLRALQEDEDYLRAVKRINDMQQPILDNTAQKIAQALKEFLPEVEDVNVMFDERDRYRALRRSVDIIVDDGTATSLRRKGDGVQSLAAIGLLRGVSPSNRHLLLALEEPESHLHPGAIHRLRRVLRELSKDHQVVITTHCPAFADRVDIESNIIVEAKKAKQASNISQIRDALGVHASDNLLHAQVVLVVEGVSDEKILRKILTDESDMLKEAFEANTVVIDWVGGSGNLSYKLSELRNAIVEYYCFFDNDRSGRTAVEKSVESGLLSNSEYTLASTPSGKDAEIEDLIEQNIYKTIVEKEFGVVLKGKLWRCNNKWTDRIRGVFKEQGKIWNEKTEKKVKESVANAVADYKGEILQEHRRSPIDGLIRELCSRLE